MNKNREGDQKSRQSLCVLGYVYSLSGLYFLIVLLTSFQCFQSEVCVSVCVCVCVCVCVRACVCVCVVKNT